MQTLETAARSRALRAAAAYREAMAAYCAAAAYWSSQYGPAGYDLAELEPSVIRRLEAADAERIAADAAWMRFERQAENARLNAEFATPSAVTRVVDTSDGSEWVEVAS